MPNSPKCKPKRTKKTRVSKEEKNKKMVSAIREISGGLSSGIPVSNMDACDYLEWQWERLSRQMKFMETKFPDGSCNSMSELTYDPTQCCPLTISDRALHLYTRAKDMGCTEWEDKFLQLIGRRLLTISKRQLFLKLEILDVCKILGSDHLDVADEMNILRAAQRWLDYDSSRARYMPCIMGCVRFGLMSREDIIKCLLVKRNLRESIVTLSPYQSSVTHGLVCLCMQELGIYPTFPEFCPPPRHRQVRKRRIGTGDFVLASPSTKSPPPAGPVHCKPCPEEKKAIVKKCTKTSLHQPLNTKTRGKRGARK